MPAEVARTEGGISVERYSDKAIRIIDSLHTERLDYHSEYLPLIDAAQRLAAYENTCLEPEEIDAQKFLIAAQKDPVKLARIRELVQADRDGRCVVLPSGGYSNEDGERALRNAMFVVCLTNNGANRYAADAIAEKLTRESAESALNEQEVNE